MGSRIAGGSQEQKEERLCDISRLLVDRYPTTRSSLTADGPTQLEIEIDLPPSSATGKDPC